MTRRQPTTKAEKSALVERWAARFNAQLGKPVITYATDERFKIKRVPTGILSLDRLTGGGYVRGRHVELYGDWQACKSYAVYRCIAEAQKRGEVCALIDSEHVFDPQWFAHVGGNAKDLLIFRPVDAEQTVKTLQLFTQQDKLLGRISVVGIDSVASLLPREVAVKDLDEGDDRVAALARFMSRGLPRITTLNEDTLFLWTNQWREKVSTYQGAKSTPGGRALGYYASIRIEMVLGEKERETTKTVIKGAWVERKVTVGQWVHMRTVKNKTASPERTESFMFDLRRREIDRVREIIDLGMQDELIVREGNEFSALGQPPVKELFRLRQKLAKDDELRRDLQDMIAITSEAGGHIGT